MNDDLTISLASKPGQKKKYLSDTINQAFDYYD